MQTLTIVIPIRNRAEYLPALFGSLTAIDYEGLDVILVDNGSTDSSLAMCHSFAEDAPMTVFVYQELQPGANYARNRGLEACRTEWIYFFDSDDILSNDFVSDVMLSADDCDMVAFPTWQEFRGRLGRRTFVPESSAASQILTLTLNTQGMLFRTEFLRHIGGWNVNLDIWQDWELGIRALLNGARVHWLPEKAYHQILVHDNSITGPSFAARREAIQHTMDVVSGEVHNPVDCRALFLRTCLVNGQLLRQQSAPLIPPCRPGMLYRILGFLIRCYVACGGRGAWRLALALC